MSREKPGINKTNCDFKQEKKKKKQKGDAIWEQSKNWKYFLISNNCYDFQDHLCTLNILTIVQAVTTANLNLLSGFEDVGPLVVTEVQLIEEQWLNMLGFFSFWYLNKEVVRIWGAVSESQNFLGKVQ